MCLAVIALDSHPRFAVVVAANRDEFHARAAAPAHWWNDVPGSPLLAGRDLEHGGTWLGVTPQGRWAFVTNVREPGRHDVHAPSRGSLVPAFLRDDREPRRAIESIVGEAMSFNGFNLVGGDGVHAAFGSNRGMGAQALVAGIHGVSNAQLDTPWPKLARAKAGVSDWASAADPDLGALWRVLADPTPAHDDELPDTGIGRDRERLLSSPFIKSASYGTRCSTVFTLSRDGEARFIERSFDAAGGVTGEVECRFRVNRPVSAIATRVPSRGARCRLPRTRRP